LCIAKLVSPGHAAGKVSGYLCVPRFSYSALLRIRKLKLEASSVMTRMPSCGKCASMAGAMSTAVRGADFERHFAPIMLIDDGRPAQPVLGVVVPAQRVNEHLADFADLVRLKEDRVAREIGLQAL